MQPIKRGSSVFLVDAISIEPINENGYQFKAIFDNNPFTVTRVNTIIRKRSTDGKIYIKLSTSTDHKGTGKTSTILYVWS